MMLVLLLLLGLVFGSFVNALVWRLHEQSSAKGKKNKQLSVVQGRSMCPHCRHELATKDLIPVASWLMLKGKCRYCGKPISWQYPVVELLTAGLFVLSYVYWPLPLHGFGLFEFVPWLIFLTGFMALAVYDLRWFTLPNRIIRPLIGLAVVQVLGLSVLYHGDLRTLAGAAFGALLIGGIFYVLFLVSQGAWIGGGDVRLGVLLGLLVGGPFMSFLVLFISSLLGTILAVPLLATHKLQRTSRLPFGPFLLVGAIITRLFGAALINWYTHHLVGS